MNDRGGRWLLVQFPLVALAAILGRVGPRLPVRWRRVARPLGLGLISTGMAFFWAGLASLGRNLTPFPRPKEDARLVRSGPYRLVRNPVYAGGIVASLGNALFHGRPLGLLGTALLVLFFDAKARREEAYLERKFPEYAAYRRTTSKLVPGLY
jgi:protein-S-isoprenylcysteine O-methyltransferase Ste14